MHIFDYSRFQGLVMQLYYSRTVLFCFLLIFAKDFLI